VNGIHDMGGMHGFGPIIAEPETAEPVYHAAWEAAVHGLFAPLLARGHWSLDRFRKLIESQPPEQYLRHSYYENWLASLTRLSVEAGLITEDELRTGVVATPAPPPGSWSPMFSSNATPAFAAGDRVRARNRNPQAHTREPRYVRGRQGTVIAHIGAEPLPERAAENIDEPQPVYLVRFEGAELWGADASRDPVYIELWEDYLEPAE
jgi:nitrile hydratase subunit beta